MKHRFITTITGLLALGFTPMAQALTVKILDRSPSGQVLLNAGKNRGLGTGEKLVVHDGSRTLGWITLTEVHEAASLGAVSEETFKGVIGPGQWAVDGPLPLQPPGSPGAPEGLDTPAPLVARAAPARDETQLRQNISAPQALEKATHEFDAGRWKDSALWLKTAIRADETGKTIPAALALLADVYAMLEKPDQARRALALLDKINRPVVVEEETENIVRPDVPPNTPSPKKMLSLAPGREEQPPGGLFTGSQEFRNTPSKEAADETEGEDPFADPFKKPLATTAPKRQDFFLKRVAGEAHSGGDNPDDFLYALVAVGRTFGEKTLGSALVLERYNQSENEGAALVAGLNITRLHSPHWIFYGTLTHSDQQGGSNNPDPLAASLGAQRQLLGRPGRGLSAQGISSWGLKNGDDTLNARLDYRTPWGKKNTVQAAWSYTYNRSLEDAFLQELSAGLGRRVGRSLRLAAEVVWADPLFDVATGSPRPKNDTILRVNLTEVK